MNEKPIPESYWVLAGSLLAGGYPGLHYDEFGTRQRLSAFIRDGFDTFFDLTCEGERPSYLPALQKEARESGRTIQHRRFSFPDFDVPTPEGMAAVLDAIDAALSDGHKVYLHCLGGIGRTGTTVGCWLIRHGMEPGQALFHLNALYHNAAQSIIFPHCPEANEQVDFILNWKEDGLA